MEGGTASVGFSIRQQLPKERIGVMVAANSGRPGGSVGLEQTVDPSQVHAGHKTQEEDLMSTWLLAEAGTNLARQSKLFSIIA